LQVQLSSGRSKRSSADQSRLSVWRTSILMRRQSAIGRCSVGKRFVATPNGEPSNHGAVVAEEPCRRSRGSRKSGDHRIGPVTQSFVVPTSGFLLRRNVPHHVFDRHRGLRIRINVQDQQSVQQARPSSGGVGGTRRRTAFWTQRRRRLPSGMGSPEVRALDTPKGRTKYENTNAEHDGRTFDSRRELKRYLDLAILQDLRRDSGTRVSALVRPARDWWRHASDACRGVRSSARPATGNIRAQLPCSLLTSPLSRLMSASVDDCCPSRLSPPLATPEKLLRESPRFPG
jgi:hypothetical protein